MSQKIGVFSQKIGVFSQKAAMRYGYAEYKNPEGETVRVTGVYNSLKQIEEKYRWPDKVIIGPVTEYLGRTDTYFVCPLDTLI